MRLERRGPAGIPGGAWVPAAVLLVGLLGSTGRARAQTGGQFVTDHGAPGVEAARNAEVLAYKRQEQEQMAKRARVFHGFQFVDRREASGIRFVHRIVDDAGKYHKAVHYDHGNGISVADVDGDGKTDLYFLSQMGGNQLWRNRGDGTFEDITARAGVGLAGRVSVAAAFGDIDNDGDPDLFVTTVRMGNAMFRNEGGGIFKEVTDQAGVTYFGHSSAAVFFDFDRDGNLDLFLTNIGVYTTEARGRGGYYIGYPDAFSGHLLPERFESSILYRNQGGGRFEDVTSRVGLVDFAFSGDASPVDFNGDGFPDLYLPNMQGYDRYYENMGGKRFVDRRAKVFPRTPWGTMGIKSLDWNNDGRMDLFLTDMHSDMSDNIGPDKERRKSDMKWTEDFLLSKGMSIFGNAFYENRGDLRFEEISDRIGAENYWPWGVSVGDVNADGWPDIFIASSMNYPFRYGINSMLVNNEGEEFLDMAFPLGIEPRPGERTMIPWFEVDCDGADAGHQRCRGRSGDQTVEGALGTRSAVILDLEDDGDLDIVTNDFNSPPMVLVSDLASRRPIHFLKVRLEGTASNRDGLGARVVVQAGDRTYTQVHDGLSGYLGHSLLPLYFGLGDEIQATRVEVLWPSGHRQEVTKGIPKNDTLLVRESPAAAQKTAAASRR